MACVDIASWDVPGATDTAFGRPVQPPAAGTLSPVPWGQPRLHWGARVPGGQPGLRWGWMMCCQAQEWGLVLGRDTVPARGSEGHPLLQLHPPRTGAVLHSAPCTPATSPRVRLELPGQEQSVSQRRSGARGSRL